MINLDTRIRKTAFLVYIILFLLAIPLASAECISAQIAKSTYYPGETFQAEITGNFTGPPTYSNIFFYKGIEEIHTPFYLEKLASNKYFVYAELSKSYGEHNFIIKDVLCKEEGITKAGIVNESFLMQKPIYLAYSWLIAQTENWDTLSEEENALALLALNYASIREGKDSLLEKSKNNECWPYPECDVKTTALAALALKSLNESDKPKEWLLESQNSFDMGLWDLIVESPDMRSCSISINTKEKILALVVGTNTLPLEDYISQDQNLAINLSCENISARVTRTYLGKVAEFPLVNEGGILKIELSNEKCWGSSYRSDCNAEATAYALFALNELGISNSKAETWLKNNAQTTVERAVVYLLTGNSESKEWLLNNQALQGYWANQALALSDTPDITSTVFSAIALENEKAVVNKAKSWLLSNYTESFGDLKETAYTLSYLFPPNQIEPILGVSPAVIKARANEAFSIKLKNNGAVDINVKATTKDDSKTEKISDGNSKTISFTYKSTSGSIVYDELSVEYSSVLSEEKRSYKVPLIIVPSGTAGIEESVNETIGEENFIESNIIFIEDKINQSVSEGEKRKIQIELKNPSSKAVENIVLTYTLNLYGIVEEIFPIQIPSLGADQSEMITVSINAENAFGSYEGLIEAHADGLSVSIPVSLVISQGEVIGRTCAESGGKICLENEECAVSSIATSDASSCCLGACNKKTPPVKKSNAGVWIGILLLVIAVLAAVAFMFLRLKKRKGEMADVIGKIEEKYRKVYGGKENM